MLTACYCPVYARYKFPACSDLVFLTDIASSPLTLVLFNLQTGYIHIAGTTDAVGKFTLPLAALPKPYLLNPYIGFFKVSFIYLEKEYELFLTDEGEYSGIEIEAEKWILPPDTYTFSKFIIHLSDDDTLPPPDDNIAFTYTLPFQLA
jgi:hypothetical protein